MTAGGATDLQALTGIDVMQQASEKSRVEMITRAGCDQWLGDEEPIGAGRAFRPA